jgi:potassium voltage-gated channel Eag-related subfamily H protein 2
MVDVIFAIDLILSFRTAFWHEDELVWDQKKVAIHYMTSWFIIDFIGSFPFSALDSSKVSQKQGKSIKAFAKYWKIPKLLRLGRLVKYTVKYTQYFHLVKLLNLFVVSLHWNACMYAAVTYANNNEKGTLELKELFDSRESEYFNIGAMYAESMYISSAMLCGFERIKRDVGDPEVIRGGWQDVYMMVVSVGGMFYWSYFIAHVTADVIMTTGERSRFQHKVERVTSDLKKNFLPHELQVRVRRYYEILWRNSSRGDNTFGQGYNDPDLSENLRCEIALLMHQKLLIAVPLFEACEDKCLCQILVALNTQLFLRGEVIMHQGAPANSMMIVAKGVVRILSQDMKTIVGELKAGAFFGEMALIHECRRSSTLYAATFVHLKVLHVNDFKRIAFEYPDFREHVEEIAKARKTKNSMRDGAVASHPPSQNRELRGPSDGAKDNMDGSSTKSDISALSADMNEMKLLLKTLVSRLDLIAPLPPLSYSREDRCPLDLMPRG